MDSDHHYEAVGNRFQRIGKILSESFIKVMSKYINPFDLLLVLIVGIAIWGLWYTYIPNTNISVPEVYSQQELVERYYKKLRENQLNSK